MLVPYPKKSLYIRLAPDDLLFYLDLPYATAPVFLDYLKQQFTTNQIFPTTSDPDYTLFKTFSAKQLAQYRMIYGGFMFGPYDEGIYKYMTANPISLTVLVDPVYRVVCQYYAKLATQEIPASMTLETYVTAERYTKDIDNCQTRYILGAINGNLDVTNSLMTLSPDAKLYVAQQNLEQFAFVGIAEYLKQSMELLAYTFGWRQPKTIMETPPTYLPASFNIMDIDAHIIELIRERTELDQKLYTYGLDIFYRRRNQMASELLAIEKRRKLGFISLQPLTLTEEQYYFYPKRLWEFRVKVIPQGSKREKVYWKLINTKFVRYLLKLLHNKLDKLDPRDLPKA